MFHIVFMQKVTPLYRETDVNLWQSGQNYSGSVYKLKAHSSVLHNGASLCVGHLLQKGITILTQNLAFQYSWQETQTDKRLENIVPE